MCPFSSSRGVPVLASHTFAVWSRLPVTMRVPSGLNATLIHLARVPLQFQQGRARPGVPQLRRPVPTAGDDARAVRAERHASHPARVPLSSSWGVPVLASHTFAVRSPLPVTMRVPSGLNATLATPFVCPFSSNRGVPVLASHTFAVWSSLPVTMRVPSGLNASRAHTAGVPLEREDQGAGLRVPHLRRQVIAAGDDARAVRAERHAVRRARVPSQVQLRLPRPGVPHLRPVRPPVTSACRPG